VPVSEGKHYALSVVDCGFLLMPTGRLTACDPFASLQKNSNLVVQIPPERYRVLITLADVSDNNDGSHMREAYATLMLDETRGRGETAHHYALAGDRVPARKT